MTNNYDTDLKSPVIIKTLIVNTYGVYHTITSLNLARVASTPVLW